MQKIKTLFLLSILFPKLSGGYRRTFEVLRGGKSEGIEYVVCTDSKSCENGASIFPDFMKVLSNYKVYLSSLEENHSFVPGLKQVMYYLNILRSSLFISKVASEENVDIIVSDESNRSLITCCLAGKFSSKPWTAVFQPTTPLLQPSTSSGVLDITNILNFVTEKLGKKLSFMSRIGFGINLLMTLKVAEKSPLILPVSTSVVEEIKQLNPRIKFYAIEPGNAIYLERFAELPSEEICYDAIFFARLVPEKGLFDLPIIWKEVVSKSPRALLAVAGINERQMWVDQFLKIVEEEGLGQNIKFLGRLDDNGLIKVIKSSKLLLYPSLADSLPTVILESLACGTPVVAYDIPPIKHNFEKCDAVFRCPPKNIKKVVDAILAIVENETRIQLLAMKAKEYSKKYTWQNVVRAEKAGYFKVIDAYNETSH